MTTIENTPWSSALPSPKPSPLIQVPTVILNFFLEQLSAQDCASLSLSCRFFKRVFDLSPAVWKIAYPNENSLRRVWNLTKKEELPLLTHYALLHAFQEPRGRQLFVAEDDENTGTAFAMNATGLVMAVGMRDGSIHIREKGKKFILTADHKGPVVSIAFNDEGSLMVTASGKAAHIWVKKQNKWKPQFAFTGHTGHLARVAVNATGSLIVLVAAIAYVLQKKKDEWKKEVLTANPDGGKLIDVTTNDSGSLIVTASRREVVCIWRKNSRGQWKIAKLLTGISVSANGKGSLVAVGGRDQRVRVWEKINHKWKRAASLDSHTDSVHQIRTSKNGSTIISASYDGKVCMWRKKKGIKATWNLTALIAQGPAGVQNLAMNASATLIGTCFLDERIQLWTLNARLSNRLILLQLQRQGKVASFSDLYRELIKYIRPYLTPQESCNFVVNREMARYAFPALADRFARKRRRQELLTRCAELAFKSLASSLLPVTFKK